MTHIFQALPVFSSGDAIGSAVLRTRTLLTDLGFQNSIHAELIDSRLQRHATPVDEMWSRIQPGDAVMYHLSIGARMVRDLARTPAHLVVVHHNLTPPRFFRDTNPRVRYWLERGEDDLRLLAPRAGICICDSEYNAVDARAAGAASTVVMAPPVDISRLQPRAAQPQKPPILLFVGRLAPNKRHDDLIRVLAALRSTDQPDARLVLAGGSDDTGAYVAGLRDLAERLGVADAVEIAAHRLSDAELGDLYAAASVFVCASDHEGFCIPLLEAMAFSVPVVAYAAGAVPDTLGGGGILINHKDPLVWAGVISRVIDDADLRRDILDRGALRLRDFDESILRNTLHEALATAGVAP